MGTWKHWFSNKRIGAEVIIDAIRPQWHTYQGIWDRIQLFRGETRTYTTTVSELAGMVMDTGVEELDARLMVVKAIGGHTKYSITNSKKGSISFGLNDDFYVDEYVDITFKRFNETF